MFRFLYSPKILIPKSQNTIIGKVNYNKPSESIKTEQSCRWVSLEICISKKNIQIILKFLLMRLIDALYSKYFVDILLIIN